MLVMTTIFISKMEGLPPTSATKMIDYWLILCQLVPFAEVVLLTAIEYLREDKQEEEIETSGIVSVEDNELETKEGNVTKVDWVPMLTIIGKILV